MGKMEIVETLSDCQTAVRTLEREPYIAVDSEGVHLGKVGPMTLLQVATSGGHVFLFDVTKEPRMFKDGGLKRLLEDSSIVKVMHAGRNDGKALYYQHGVLLHNVHDTQLAQVEMERAEGRCFPSRQKLQDVVHMYCPEKEHLVDDKGTVQTKCNKTEGEYWAKRPLTEEMKQYAAGDVLTIIPEVYLAQTRELKSRGLEEVFRKSVDNDLAKVHDQRLEEEKRQSEKELVEAVLRQFVRTPGNENKTLEDIEDENVLDALEHLRLDQLPGLELPATVRQLKLQMIENYLDKVEQEMEENGDDYEAGGITSRRVYGYIRGLETGTPLRLKAQRLEERINQQIMQDIQRKYTVQTPAVHMDDVEKRVLTRSIRPKGAEDSSIHPVLLALYWKAKLEDLEAQIDRYQTDPDQYRVSDGYVKMLKFYLSGDVPEDIKKNGTWFLRELEKVGKVDHPRKHQQRRQGKPKHEQQRGKHN